MTNSGRWDFWRNPLLLIFGTQAFVAADDLTTIQPLVRAYCVGCHGPTKQKADLRLDRLAELDASTFDDLGPGGKKRAGPVLK